MDLSTFFGFTATVAAIVGIYLTFIQMQLPFLKRASDPKIPRAETATTIWKSVFR